MDFSLNSGESGLLLRIQSLGLVAKESEVVLPEAEPLKSALG